MRKLNLRGIPSVGDNNLIENLIHTICDVKSVTINSDSRIKTEQGYDKDIPVGAAVSEYGNMLTFK